MSSGRWRVVLWDDDTNTPATVAFVLHRVVGLPLGTALDLPHEVGALRPVPLRRPRRHLGAPAVDVAVPSR